MANSYFRFKKFIVHQQLSAMKVTTDSCLFGAWCAKEISEENSGGKNCLDIGAGTGLLSLMIAQKTQLNIDAIEIDPNAVTEAKENLKQSPFNNINLVEGDVMRINSNQYDYIVSNPPFYENELKSPETGRQLAHHGTQLTWSDLFRFISDHIKAEGTFFLLLPFKRKADLEKNVGSNNLFIEKMIFVKPTADHQPTRIMVKGSKKEKSCSEENLNIRDKDGNYSAQFTDLLKDYYLNL